MNSYINLCVPFYKKMLFYIAVNRHAYLDTLLDARDQLSLSNHLSKLKKVK